MVHECKVCGKSFPCGRSLGGHMRSHLSFTSGGTAAGSPEPRSSAVFSTGYGLRENPRKTWRLSEPAPAAAAADDKLAKLCKDCGKCFSSWKSLFGHMSCHSRSKLEEEEEEDDDDDEEEEDEEEYEEIEDQEQVMEEEEDRLNEGQSDNEIVIPRKKQRSRRVASITCSSSSTAAEIDKEQEDGALTLVMLSRDIAGFWSGVNSFAESSNGSSVISEIKESELQKPKSDESSKKCSFGRKNPNFSKEQCKKRMMINAAAHNFQLPDEESKKLYFKSNEDQYKKRMITSGTRIADRLLQGEEEEASKKCFFKNKNLNFSEEHQSRKNAISEFFGTRLSTSSAVNGVPSGKKRGQYECTLCQKSFLSYQAFGGHRASHMRMSKDRAELKVAAAKNRKVIDEAVHNNSAIDASIVSSRKAKEHQCPVCFKIFPSGQALGGHKRSHLLSSSSTNGRRVLEIKAELIDLNLPAPINESSNAENGTLFSPCWMSIDPE